MDALTTILGALAILFIGIFLDRTFPTIGHLFLFGALSLVFGIVLIFIKNKYGREPKDIFPLLKRDALEKWGTKWQDTTVDKSHEFYTEASELTHSL